MVCQDDTLENYQKNFKKFEWGETKMEKNYIMAEKPGRKGLLTEEDIVIEKEIPKKRNMLNSFEKLESYLDCLDLLQGYAICQ